MREEKRTEPTAYQISPADNVATALTEVYPGTVYLSGESAEDSMEGKEHIPCGHKIALRDIKKGEPIIKYAIPIGTATETIHKGEWVHLHRMRSNYDERSSHLNIVTGVPEENSYE